MDINLRTRKILQMCNTKDCSNESASIRDNEIIENTDSSDPEPFEDSGDEYVPINESSDTDEGQEEQFENINLLPEEVNNAQVVGENQITKSRRGRKKENKDEATRKRKSNPSKWTRNVRKSLKTQGSEYTSVSGNKTITAKQLKAACTCKQKCFQKISPEERQSLFTGFYKLSSSGQNQFVANSIEEEGKQVQRLRRNDGKQSRRNFTRKYFLTKSNGKKIKVCQIMFLNTFDMSLKKARVIVEKKRSSEGKICPEDRRGKHENHPKVVTL